MSIVILLDTELFLQNFSELVEVKARLSDSVSMSLVDPPASLIMAPRQGNCSTCSGLSPAARCIADVFVTWFISVPLELVSFRYLSGDPIYHLPSLFIGDILLASVCGRKELISELIQLFVLSEHLS